MQKYLVLSLLAMFAGSAEPQTPARPDPADASRPSPAVTYESPFAGYKPFTDPGLARWRDVNDEMARLGGHAGHVPGSVPPRGAAPLAKPPSHSGHKGHQ